MNTKERDRLKVLQQVEEGHIKQIEAAQRLRLTARQVRRLQVRLRQEGDGGIDRHAGVGGENWAAKPFAANPKLQIFNGR